MNFMDEMKALTDEFTQSDFLTIATITRKAKNGFDPVRGTVTDTSQTIFCRAVSAPYSTKNDAGQRVEQTMLTVNQEIRSGDVLTIGGLSYTIGEVVTIAPHGEAFLWKGVAK